MNDKNSITQILNQARNEFNSGNLSLAQILCEKVLSMQSRNLIALEMLGIIHAIAKDFEMALELLSKAIKLNPANPQYFFNRGNVYFESGRCNESLSDFDRSLLIDSKNPDAWLAKGNVLKELGEFQAALTSYEKALSIAPNFYKALVNKGAVLIDLSKYDDAEIALRRAIAINKDFPDPYLNLAIALRNNNLLDAALQVTSEMIERFNKYPPTFFENGKILAALNFFDDAYIAFNNAIELNRSYVAAYYECGLILRKMKKIDEAILYFEKSIQIKTDYADAYVEIGNIWQDKNQISKALDCYDKAIELNQNFAEAYWNKALALLYSGDYQKGWDLYDWRWNLKKFMNCDFPMSPSWNGEAGGEPLLIWGEQGVGDHVLYLSILHELKNLKRQIVVAIDVRLIDLLKKIHPEFEFVDVKKINLNEWSGVHAPLAALGKIYRKKANDFSKASYPYIEADKFLIHDIKSKIKSGNKKVCGVSWLSNAKDIGQMKSLHLEQIFENLSELDLRFVNLQYGDVEMDRLKALTRTGIDLICVENLDLYNDLAGLSALIDACDFVVTISNTTAHLCGALNKPTYLLLPYGGGRHWYWTVESERTLWYPSIKMYQQNSIGDWSIPLSSLAADLKRETHGTN
jgi:tetratricopeptide (TPR) repeat protein